MNSGQYLDRKVVAHPEAGAALGNDRDERIQARQGDDLTGDAGHRRQSFTRIHVLRSTSDRRSYLLSANHLPPIQRSLNSYGLLGDFSWMGHTGIAALGM